LRENLLRKINQTPAFEQFWGDLKPNSYTLQYAVSSRVKERERIKTIYDCLEISIRYYQERDMLSIFLNVGFFPTKFLLNTLQFSPGQMVPHAQESGSCLAVFLLASFTPYFLIT
jgi:hypothetical protein